MVLGFRVLGFRVLGFGVLGFRVEVWGFGCECWICRIQSSGCRVLGCDCWS